MAPTLWFSGAPRPAAWGSADVRYLYARVAGSAWCLVVEPHDVYTHLPPHEFAVTAAVAPFRQVAEVLHGRAPDVEPAFLAPLLEPHEPASASLAGVTAVRIGIGADTYVGLARRGQAHTLFTTATGGWWVTGVVPGSPAVVDLETVDLTDGPAPAT